MRFSVGSLRVSGARVVQAPRRRQYVLRCGRFFFQAWKGAIVAGLTHFVAAVLPKAPVCALKLGDRTSKNEVFRGLLAGFRCARSSSAASSFKPSSSLLGEDWRKGQAEASFLCRP